MFFDSAIFWKFVAIGTMEVAVETTEPLLMLLLLTFVVVREVLLAAANNWAKFPAKCKPLTLAVVGDDAADTNSGVVTLVASRNIQTK